MQYPLTMYQQCIRYLIVLSAAAEDRKNWGYHEGLRSWAYGHWKINEQI